MVDRDDVEDQLGRNRQRVLPLERQVDERRRGGEPLVPAPKRIGHRALDDGGADDGAHDAGLTHHQLVAHALGVRVDVGPAPGRGPLDPLLGHLGADPLLAGAGDGQLQRRLVVGIAVLLAQTGARLLAQPGQHLRVVGQLADAHRAGRAVGDLLLDGELGTRELLVAGEIAVQLLGFPDVARPIPGDEAGAGVNQRRPLHPLGEGDDVLGPLDVGAQRRLERRVEGHPPRRVDEDVDVLGDLLGLGLREAQVRLGDVAVDDDHLLAQDRRQPLGATVPVAQRIEGRRGHHALPEPRLAVGPRAAAHHDVGPPDVGEPVEQHAEQHLPDEPGAAEDEQVPAAEDLGGRKAGERGFWIARKRHTNRGFYPEPPLIANGTAPAGARA